MFDDQAEILVPVNTTAVVTLSYRGSSIEARYQEITQAVSAPRRHVASTLRMLADELDATAARADTGTEIDE